MNDPRRLDQDSDEFERALLRSSREDGASDQARQRTLAALGVGASLAVSTTSAAALSAGSFLPWMAVGALVGGGALAGIELATSPSPRPSAALVAPARAPLARPSRENPADLPAPSLRDAPAPPALPSTDEAAAAPRPEPAPRVVPSEPARPRAVTPDLPYTASPSPSPPAPVAEVARPADEPAAPGALARAADAPSPEPPAPAATVTDPLVEELLWLDRARQAVARGDTAQARSALDEYAQRYPRGKLSTEAQVLRIEMLWRRGDREAARQQGRAFLDAHPTSPSAPRLRALLDLTP